VLGRSQRAFRRAAIGPRWSVVRIIGGLGMILLLQPGPVRSAWVERAGNGQHRRPCGDIEQSGHVFYLEVPNERSSIFCGKILTWVLLFVWANQNFDLN
jgi:hypothetical protein